MAEASSAGALPDARKPSETSTAETRASGWRRWFGRSDAVIPPSASTESPSRPGLARRLSRKVIPELPRSGTFKRQQSELRDNLEEIQSNHHYASRTQSSRTRSVDPRGKHSTRSLSNPPNMVTPRLSAPGNLGTMNTPQLQEPAVVPEVQSDSKDLTKVSEEPQDDSYFHDEACSVSADSFDDKLLEDLEKRWILNLSMHFRDRSNREKFFVTYAATPSEWRRITISLDYREASPQSLESELQQMQFQRDKSARIYESIRDSLPEIQFYDTVTNLKLQTEQDRLHVHVTEDIHEVINFPPVSAISHLSLATCPRYCEADLTFDSHLSGFVYKVLNRGRVYIKKEIPGPDTVEEFLYEINALHQLRESANVIQFEGVVTDNQGTTLKGLLISYAEKGALIDVIYDGKKEIPWFRRQRWARQIVEGLSEIHEAGFVQGDFTLSNIVIDADDNAKIIDINRRGCPVGWEPCEIVKLLESKQRISMFISTKTDLFQLGMVLWALAMQLDEPELEQRPLPSLPTQFPIYYRNIVKICLKDDPRDRLQATYLLSMFLASEMEQDETPHNDHTGFFGRNSLDYSRNVGSQPENNDFSGTRSTATRNYMDQPPEASDYYFPRGRSPPLSPGRNEMSPPRSIEEERREGLANESISDLGGPKQTSAASYADDRGQVSYCASSLAANNTHDEFQPRFEPFSNNIERAYTTEEAKVRMGTPRETGVVAISDMAGDLAGVGLHSTVPGYPQALGDDDMA